MIERVVKDRIKCDVCDTVEEVTTELGPYSTGPYKWGRDTPTPNLPDGWRILTLWEVGCARAICGNCVDRVMMTFREVGLD